MPVIKSDRYLLVWVNMSLNRARFSKMPLLSDIEYFETETSKLFEYATSFEAQFESLPNPIFDEVENILFSVDLKDSFFVLGNLASLITTNPDTEFNIHPYNLIYTESNEFFPPSIITKYPYEQQQGMFSIKDKTSIIVPSTEDILSFFKSI